MTESSLLAWLNLAVLLVTAGVIVWYTVETKRLRQEAQLQTELQVRPFISMSPLQVYSAPFPMALLPESVRLVNAGKGVATNIVVDELVISESTQLRRGPAVTHLEPGGEAHIPWRVWLRLTPGDPFGEVPDNEHERMIAAILVKTPLTFGLHYSSLAGQRYRTEIHVRDGSAQIVSTSRVNDGAEKRIH